jgi:hypothetical protein
MSGRLARCPRSLRSGLTLPELLAVILICGTLGALLLPHLVSLPALPSAAVQPPSVSAAPMPCGVTLLASDPEFTQRGFIGAALDPYPTRDGFVRISRPFPRGPADRAGLKPLDVILRVDGATARNKGMEGVQQMITSGRPGTPVRLTVRRAGPTTLNLRVMRGSFLSVFLPGIT